MGTCSSQYRPFRWQASLEEVAEINYIEAKIGEDIVDLQQDPYDLFYNNNINDPSTLNEDSYIHS